MENPEMPSAGRKRYRKNVMHRPSSPYIRRWETEYLYVATIYHRYTPRQNTAYAPRSHNTLRVLPTLIGVSTARFMFLPRRARAPRSCRGHTVIPSRMGTLPCACYIFYQIILRFGILLMYFFAPVNAQPDSTLLRYSVCP